MKFWILLLQLGVCAPVPPPSSVSISSFNMEHTLHFLPGLLSPAHSRFNVQTLRLNSRRMAWQSVVACSELRAGQTCNLTLVFKDPFESYQARVQTFTANQTSDWTMTGIFQPVTDTVLGPPDLSVSGCGNCLELQLSPPSTGGQQLRGLYRELEIQVRRSRDGAQFVLSVSFSERTVISYLQTGVEYCVSVRVSALFTKTSLYSTPICVFTSTPEQPTAVCVVLGLMGALCALSLFFISVVIFSSGRDFRKIPFLSFDVSDPRPRDRARSLPA